MANEKTEYVIRSTTHFCPKCGWCDEMDCTLEKKTWKSISGEDHTTFYHLDVDVKPECPKCTKRSVLPLTTGNVTAAVKYLLKALQ